MKKIFTAATLMVSIILFSQNVFAVTVPALIEAIWKKDANKVALLISQGADVNVKHTDTALVEAIYADNRSFDIEIVKMLIKAKGIKVNKYSVRPMGSYAWSRTPLIAASYAGRAEVVKLLLAKGAKVNLADQHLPLNTVRGALPLNTALHYAAKQGFPEIAKLLLDKGAKKEKLNASGETPLIAAAGSIEKSDSGDRKQNAVKVLTLLLDRGAKVDNCPMTSNAKYLKVDLPRGTPASVPGKVLVRGGGGISALTAAARTGFVEGAKILIDRRAKTEFKYYANKWTPLLFAAQAHHTDMVNYLLERGAKIEAKGVTGANSLLIASANLYYDTVSALLKRKANINAYYHTDGSNALMAAINQAYAKKEKDSLKIMNLLIDNGIKIDFQGSTKNTALMYASGWGVVSKNTARVKLLLDKGANTNLRNKKGETALMLAAYRGYTDIASLLLDKGADIEAKNADGRTALMIASTAVIDFKDNNRNFLNLVKLLLNKGANINVKDKKNNTALSLATRYKHKKIISLLTAKGAKSGTVINDNSGKAIVGIWQGMQNSNPYDIHCYTFKSNKTWTYKIKATAAMFKLLPKSQHKYIYDSLKTRAKQQGNRGTYSFREKWLILKTNSFFSPERVFAWKVVKRKLYLNGTTFILDKKGK